MADETFEKTIADMGFGGMSPSPVNGRFTSVEMEKAAQKAKKASSGFLSGYVNQQFAEGTTAATVRLFSDAPEDNTPFSTDIARELTAGYTDTNLIQKVIDAGVNKGTGAARKVAHEIGVVEESRARTAQGDGSYFTGSMAGYALDPVDTSVALATAAAVSAMQPQFAPVTGTATFLGVKGYRFLSKVAPQVKYYMGATGIGAAEQAGLELLRAQTVHQVTGRDVMLAASIGGAVNYGVSKYAVYSAKKQQILLASQKKVNGEELTPQDEAVLKAASDEVLANHFIDLAHRNDDFGTGTDEALQQTAGSSTAGVTRKDITEMTQAEIEATPAQRGRFVKARGLVASIAPIINSTDGLTRWLGRGLALDSLGVKGGKGVVGGNALETRDMIITTTQLPNAIELGKLYESAAKKLNLRVSQVEELVGDYGRVPDPTAIEEIKKIAKIYEVAKDKVAQMAVDANAAGFLPEMMGNIKNYLPRKVNRTNVSEFRLGTKQTAAKLPDVEGDINPAFVDLMEGAIRSEQKDIVRTVTKSLKDAGKKNITAKKVNTFIRAMARGYAKGFLTPSSNEFRKLGDGMADMDDTKAALKAAGIADEDVDVMLDVLSKNIPVKGHPRTKHRMRLDEGFSLAVKGADGEVFTLKMSDILERNARSLHESYLFQVAGAVGLAQNGINTNTLGSNFDTLMGKLPTGTPDADNARKQLDFLYKSVTGKLAYESGFSAGTQRTLARVREYGFVANMGMSGMSAIMEFSNVVFESSFETLLKTAPQFKNLILDASTGKLKNKVAHEMMVATGSGGDGMLVKVTSQRNRLEGGIAEGEDFIGSGEVTRLDEMLGKARIFVSMASGLQGVTDMLRRLSTYNFATEVAMKAQRGEVAFSAIKREQMGITDEVALEINNQIRKHSQFVDGDTLDSINLNAWDNTPAGQAAKNVFIRAARRESLQSVQEVNNGSVSYWLRSEVGKSLFQFLSFPMASLEQQAGRFAVRAANGDAVDVAKILTSGAALGTLMYIARSHMNSLGRSDREEYMKERMKFGNVMYGALGQMGPSSMFHWVYEVSTGAMDGSTKAVTPAAAGMLVGTLSGVKDLAQAIAGDDLTESEMRSMLRLLPFSSLYGARQLLNASARIVD